MDEPKPGKNFAVSSGPVNSRLVPPSALATQETAPIVLARLEAARAKLRLGASLAERLSPLQHHADNAGALGTREIVSVVGAGVSGVGLTLGLIQGAVVVIGASALLLCGFGAAAHFAGKARRQAGGEAVADTSDLVDAKDIVLLDAAMEKLAATANQDTIDRLSDLKAQISRCVALLAGAKGNQVYADEDQMFIRASVRRYLPDSIGGFLRVPQKDRESLLMEGGKTALDLLHDQIDMLKSQLQAKEERLAQLAGESLMQQQRFLAAKTGIRK
jgi:hypothetical protein